MEQVILARWQFGVTTIYHFFFIPLTIGLAFLIAIMETFYFKTGDNKYNTMIKFWGHLFLINFAMGVATGLVQEFQFGMNWSNFSRFVGDIFGVPLAIESLLAFFLESTFLGIWIFGRDKINKKLHLISIWLVSISSTLSAFWILVANSFMHNPVGYTLKNGRAVMIDFLSLISNPHVWVQFPHTLFAALSTGSFFILGISSYHLLKKNSADWVKASFKLGLVSALISTLLVLSLGDLQGKYLAKFLPMKLAAAEALWDSKTSAPLSAFSIIDEKNHRNSFEVDLPGLLSFMGFNDFHAKVAGINDLQAEYIQKYGPGNYIPPVNISFYTFRIMTGAGGSMLVLLLAAIYYHYKKKIAGRQTLLRLLVLSTSLPYIANSTGWLLTEISRYPWIVFGLLRVDDSVSRAVIPTYVLTSLIIYILLYATLIIITISLMVKVIKNSLKDDTENSSKEELLWI